MIRSIPPVDRLERDGRILLLYDRQVLELNPLARAAFELAGEWIVLSDLTARLVEKFGTPDGDPVKFVESLVDELCDIEVMERSKPIDD